MPENQDYVGKWKHLNIGLMDGFISGIYTPYNYITGNLVGQLLSQRKRFDHKGSFGHGLLMAGSRGKIGASILGARAALRSGIGLITAHVPKVGISSVHSAVPEAMLSIDNDPDVISMVPDLSMFSAIGTGPGIGKEKMTVEAVKDLLKCDLPLVLDADALNIISENPDLLDSLPERSIITPHPGEYKRLFGNDGDHFSRLKRMMEISQDRNIIIILKGAHTAIAIPEGRLYFNSTGNPGMATAGSGDVLTGIILSLLAQGYDPEDAATVSVFIHGLAGDLGIEKKSMEGLIAGDIIEMLPAAFKSCTLDD
jgi:NAD(P)H-hydrate epimerase